MKSPHSTYQTDQISHHILLKPKIIHLRVLLGTQEMKQKNITNMYRNFSYCH